MNSLEVCRQSEFADQGYLLLPKLLTTRECLKAAAGTSLNQAVQSPSWYKGGAATNPDLLLIGRNHRILSIVTQLLGPNVILWGADLIYRGPGSIHPWHSDAESAEGERFASFWIGLSGTSPETALRIVPKSHRFRRPVQRLATERHAARDELCDDTVSDWAKEFDSDSRIVNLELKNGDAVVFDGRIWHASRNQTGHRIRIALLLQYAAADVPVRIPVNYRDWPFRFEENRRPPCVVVA